MTTTKSELRRPLPAPSGIEIVVLGIPDVHAPDPLLLGPGLSRLLALLVAAEGDHVRTASLVDRLWPGETPRSGESALRVQMTRLRRSLGGSHAIRAKPGRGYQLDAAGAGLSIDSVAFEAAVAEGEKAAASQDYPAAVEALRSGLARWRGTAFEGCDDDPTIRSVQAGLEGRRGSARRTLVRCLLAKSAAPTADTVAEVHRLSSEQPGDEKLATICADGFFSSGLRSDAQRCIDRTAEYLRSELGVEPSIDLRQTGDPLATDGTHAPQVVEA